MFDLPYTRFSDLSEFLVERRKEEMRDEYILQAFNAWLGGAGQKKTFNQFIKHLGLNSKPKKDQENQMNKEDSKRVIERNMDNAKRILMLDRKNKVQKEG